MILLKKQMNIHSQQRKGIYIFKKEHNKNSTMEHTIYEIKISFDRFNGRIEHSREKDSELEDRSVRNIHFKKQLEKKMWKNKIKIISTTESTSSSLTYLQLNF